MVAPITAPATTPAPIASGVRSRCCGRGGWRQRRGDRGRGAEGRRNCRRCVLRPVGRRRGGRRARDDSRRCGAGGRRGGSGRDAACGAAGGVPEPVSGSAARPRAAFHPGVREAASPRRRVPALPRGRRRARSRCVLQPADAPASGRCRRGAAGAGVAPGAGAAAAAGRRRGVRAAWCRALASRTVRAWLSGQEVSWPGELPALRATERALRSELALPPAQAVPQDLLKAAWLQQAEAAGHPDAPVLPRAAAAAESASVRAGLLPEAAAVAAHAAAEPRPEAASAPWVQQAAAGAAEEPDVSEAARPAEAAASDVPALQPAAAGRADAAGQPPAAVRPVPGRSRRCCGWRRRCRRARGGRRALGASFGGCFGFPSGPSLWLGLRDHERRALRMRCGACELHRGQSRRGKQHETKVGHVVRTSPEGSLTKSWCDEVVGDERLRVRPDCGGRRGRGPIYFCTQITSL